jgi:hypothetical protein
VPNAFPEYFDFAKMNLPEATRACEYEAVWLDEAVFRSGPKGVDDAVAAIKKIQKNEVELNKAAEELKKKSSGRKRIPAEGDLIHLRQSTNKS